jgi:transposase
MIRPDFQKWDQTAEDIRHLSIASEHLRSRERYQALYMIGSGQSNATQWAKEIKRCKQTVLSWVHQYNRFGPARMAYRHSGGRRPKLSDIEKKS